MKIKWGALVVDGRGKLGGHVASQNKGGSYLRTKVTPANPQTIFQSSVRAIFGALSQAWSGLTASQITAWNSAVDEWKQTNVFGDIKLPSGKALFQRLNMELETSGQTQITSPPAKAEMVEGVITSGSIGITAEELALVGIFATTGANVKYFGTPPVSAGTTFVKNKLRQFGAGPCATYTAENAYDDYVAKFGVPSPGDKVYVGIKYVLPNGQASPLQTLQVVVTA